MIVDKDVNWYLEGGQVTRRRQACFVKTCPNRIGGPEASGHESFGTEDPATAIGRGGFWGWFSIAQFGLNLYYPKIINETPAAGRP